MSQNPDTPAAEEPCPGCGSPLTCRDFGRCIMDPLDDEEPCRTCPTPEVCQVMGCGKTEPIADSVAPPPAGGA